MKVEDVMTHDVVTVPPGASLKDAARQLVEHRISGLPVVDNQGHVLGVVSEADVLPKEAAEMAAPWIARLASRLRRRGRPVEARGPLGR